MAKEIEIQSIDAIGKTSYGIEDGVGILIIDIHGEMTELQMSEKTFDQLLSKVRKHKRQPDVL